MHGNATPAPIRVDHGRVRQVIVQCTGPRRGAAGYRGPSGRKYWFDATPNSTHCYVLGEDADRFSQLADFEVLEDTWIDPERDQLADQAAGLQELRAMFEASMTSPSPLVEDAATEVESTPDPVPPTSSRQAGRPPTSDRERRWYWHLLDHCPKLWTTAQLARQFGPGRGKNPLAATRKRVQRIPDEIRQAESCEFCDSDCYPDPPDVESPDTL